VSKDIDYSKTVNEDDIIEIEDNIKGVMVLLSGLVVASEAGTHQYQKEAYNTLSIALNKTLKDLEDIKPNIDYMQDKIRE
jgi:hypothetical protein